MSAQSGLPILQVDGLRVWFGSPEFYTRAVDGVSFSLAPGEILGIVGESGSGKTVLLQSLLGVVRGQPGVVDGQVTYRFEGGVEHRPYEGVEQGVRRMRGPVNGKAWPVAASRRWLATVDRRFGALRGSAVGLVLQNGRAALDPFWTVGRQILSSVAQAEPELDKDARREVALKWLRKMGFDQPARVAANFPHELSGGMAQRVMIAIVLARRPQILLLDEVTTGLDVSLQAAVLELLRELYEQYRFSAVIVTHDLGLARSISNRILIMRNGRAVQSADTESLFSEQIELEPYTHTLLSTAKRSMDGLFELSRPPSTVRAAAGGTPAIVVEGVGKQFRHKGWVQRLFRHANADAVALSDVSFSVTRGECVALVGESGSGKTTLGRVLVALLRPDLGRVCLSGASLDDLLADAPDRTRRRFQMLFQNPYTSLNPEMTPETAVAECLRLNGAKDAQQARRAALQLLAKAGLEKQSRQRLATLSGGERRRVGLLRAMSSSADIVVLDEPSSGLDAVYRNDVISMIERARQDNPDRIFVIISHDLGFVSSVADRVLVMLQGRVVEENDIESFKDPSAEHHPYTRLLLETSRAVLGNETDVRVVRGRVSSAIGDNLAPPNGEHGCSFAERCWRYRTAPASLHECNERQPDLVRLSPYARVACHEVSDADG